MELLLLAEFYHVSIDYLVGKSDYPVRYGKKKIIFYSVDEILKVPDYLNDKEIEMIIRIIADGKKYSWYELE